MKVEYDSNNSGGRWWLKDEQWKALEAAGWKVRWFSEQERKIFAPDEDGRWLGALADRAERDGMGMKEAVAEWERITGLCSTDAGCPCCGQPHRFNEYDENGKQTACGPSIFYGASW